jgi:hypothetical protein
MTEFSLTSPEPKDNRFQVFKLLIEQMFMWRWHVMPRWGAPEADQLKRFIKENSTLTDLEVKRALYNLSQSSDIPEMQRPSRWLPRLESYVVHNHNVYGRNPDAKTGETFAERDSASTSAAAERIKQNLRRPSEHVPAPTPSNEPRVDGSVPTRHRQLSAGGSGAHD